MNLNQSKTIASKCNRYGVLVHYEVYGVQHEFQLSMKRLSPTSVVYKRNKVHIKDTKYVLLPPEIATQIKNVGKNLFDEKYYEDKRESSKMLTGYDYSKTRFGRYLRIESLDKFIDLTKRLTNRMNHIADAAIMHAYDSYYRNSFLIAFEYFAGDMREVRELMEKYSGEFNLFWGEIAELNAELKRIQEQFDKANPNTKFTFSDLSKFSKKENLPGLQTAYKLRNVPQNKQDYLDSLGISYILSGFHTESFCNRKWTKEMSNICSFDTVKKYLLLPESYYYKSKEE